MDTSSEDFKALVDVVAVSLRGLAGTSLETGKQVLRALHDERNFTLERMLHRADWSPHAVELWKFIPELFPNPRETTKAIINYMVASRGQEISRENLQEYADRYWVALVKKFIERGDFSRAWTEIRSAFRGFYPSALRIGEVVNPGSPSNLAASIEWIHEFIDLLYVAMRNKGVVDDFRKWEWPHDKMLCRPYLRAHRDGDYKAFDITYSPPGLAFVYGIGEGCMRRETGGFRDRGKKAMAIAAHFQPRKQRRNSAPI